MAKNQEFIAVYHETRNVFESGQPDDPNYRRTIIATVTDDDGNEQTIKGEALPKQLVGGMTYRFFGRFVTHHRHGKQFVFANFAAETPATESGIVAYLSQLDKQKLDPSGELGITRGLGKGTAHMLWEAYGPAAVDRLRERPAIVAETIKSLSLTVARAASEWLQRNQLMERAKIDLIGLLDGRGVPKKIIGLLIAKYGSKAAELIRRSPYLLMQFSGVGFGTADKLYLDLGHSSDRLKRQSLCIWNMLRKDSEGHTWHPMAKVEAAVRANVSGSNANTNRALELAFRAGLLARHVDANGVHWIAEARKAENEAAIARYVTLARGESPMWPSIDSVDGPSEHQREQYSLATRGVIGCLAGGPGTGKTFTAATAINQIVASCGDGDIAVCAPTGKAAVRLTEALQAYGTGIEAITIHRLLCVESATDGGFSFAYGEGLPLPFRFVIIDESSMIDTDLMAALFAARAPGTHYLFIGDHRQLAPVGHGCPFFDLQRAGVPTGELTEVRRNSGRIVEACSQIRESSRFDTSPKISPEEGENLFCLDANTPESQIDGLIRLYQRIGSGDADLIWDIQVLVAVNKKSPLSRKVLNEKLQGLLNPGGKTVSGNPFRIGDKIINLKNGKFPCEDPGSVEADADGNVFVANGEQAEVLVVEPARTIARLQSPDRVIVIPHGSQGDASDNEDEDRGSAGSWDLAYAISTHKSQGSEWPMIVVMLDEYPGAKYLCSRNWIYTAISRAKRLCILIGKASTGQQMARRDGLRRKTFLAELIAGDQQSQQEQTVIVRLSSVEFRELFLANA